MLSDFLLLEEYFEGPETARFYEELYQTYGPAALQRAVMAGYLKLFSIKCGAEKGRLVARLTRAGRAFAAQNPAA